MIHARLRAAAGRDRIPTDGLIAWYTMDNISGSTLVDEQGNYDATIVGSVTQTTGIIGQALSFPGGAGNRFDTGIASLAPSGITISQWVNLSSINTAPNDYGTIHSARGSSANVGVFTYQTPAANSATGNASIRAHINTSSGLKSFDTAYVPTASAWFHLAVVYDGSLDVYINGSADANGGIAGGSIVGTTNTLWFGDCRKEDGAAGLMDQVRIYERALSPGEITQLYNEGV